MAPQSILFTDHAEAIGGAEQSLLLLLEFLDRERFRPVLACPPGMLAQRAAELRVEVISIPLPRLRKSLLSPYDLLRGARSLAYTAKEVGAVMLVANTVRGAVYSSLAAMLARKPFLWYMRDFWLSETRPHNLWLDRHGKWILSRMSARVIANSKAVAASLPDPSRVRVVHNGIDVSFFNPALDGSAFRRDYNIPDDVPVAGMVGRLRPWKGQDRFIRAASLLRPDWEEARFVIVGGTPLGPQDGYPATLEGMVAELGMGDRVVLTGQLEDVRPALAAMDVFVHPGEPEPFGLVNLEAMAMGRPIVAFAHGALPEIVLDRQTGLLVPPGDVHALADCVRSLFQDPGLGQRMGSAGRVRVESEFRIEKTAWGMEAVLEEVLANQRVMKR